jgi:hypothetical protein
VSRLIAILTFIAAAFALVTPTANAAPALDSTLAALWTTVLETPSATNPFGSGGAKYDCINIGDNTVAPFGPTPVDQCQVNSSTKIFVAAASFECSTFEGNGTTEAELRACARSKDVQAAPTVRLDGRPVAVLDVETPLLKITLPPDNIFNLPAGTTGLSVAHGWVVHVDPLTIGNHTIHVGNVPGRDYVTRIKVSG